jgi:hypothetical protein
MVEEHLSHSISKQTLTTWAGGHPERRSWDPWAMTSSIIAITASTITSMVAISIPSDFRAHQPLEINSRHLPLGPLSSCSISSSISSSRTTKQRPPSYQALGQNTTFTRSATDNTSMLGPRITCRFLRRSGNIKGLCRLRLHQPTRTHRIMLLLRATSKEGGRSQASRPRTQSTRFMRRS